MSKTIFNQSNIDFTKQPMFFGEDQNVQRFDTYKYPVFDKLTQTQLGYFWRPEEVSLQKDRSDFANFRPEQKHIFTSNLKYQTLLDSVQGRGPAIAFLHIVHYLNWNLVLLLGTFLKHYTHVHTRTLLKMYIQIQVMYLIEL